MYLIHLILCSSHVNKKSQCQSGGHGNDQAWMMLCMCYMQRSWGGVACIGHSNDLTWLSKSSIHSLLPNNWRLFLNWPVMVHWYKSRMLCFTSSSQVFHFYLIPRSHSFPFTFTHTHTHTLSIWFKSQSTTFDKFNHIFCKWK